MRIIAGQRRGHRFDGPGGKDLRPTSDLVREAIFNILRDEVEGRLVVDLFAGTGALGLEALSRGAERAVFVERDRETAALIRRNLAILRFEDRGAVLHLDAYRWARSFRAPDDRPVVVLLDPPYREFEGRSRPRVRQLLEDLVGALPAGSTILAESGQALDASVLPDLDAWDRRRYGSRHLAIRTLTPAAESESPSSNAIPAGPDRDDRNRDDEPPGT